MNPLNEQRRLSWPKYQARVNRFTDAYDLQSFDAGFSACLDHVQPQIDAIAKLIARWKESRNDPSFSPHILYIINECIEDLEAILASDITTANDATMKAMEGEDGR